MGDAEEDAALKAYTVVRVSSSSRLCSCSHNPDTIAPLQQLRQADISLLKKSELGDRLAIIRKLFDKYLKDKEATANKAVRLLCATSGTIADTA